MDFDLRLFVTDIPALGALVSLSMDQLVFGQVVFADKGFVAHGASKVPLPVCGCMLPQSGVLCKSLVTQFALVWQLFGVRPVVCHQLGLVPQDLVTQAALFVVGVVLDVVG